MADQEKKAVPAAEEEKLNDQMIVRREKMRQFAEAGIYPFGQKYEWDHHARDIKDNAETLAQDGTHVSLAGRLMALRRHGKTAFCVLRDLSGEIQLYFRKDVVGEKPYELFKLLDIGDIIGVEGDVFTTHTGEITVRVETWTLLSKSLRPLPEKFHGLTDKETRYRQRYLDLIVNPEVTKTFVMRSRIIKGIREYLDKKNFLEVETPMMHPIAGGAAARPFVTHHNALDIPLFMRIAPELYLKRLVVGGFERVFEINRNFRNEGVSARHNPEFTMMEFYEAFSDYHRMMDMTEGVIRACANAVCGSLHVPYNGKEVDLEKRFDRLTIVDAIKKYNPHYTDEQLNDEEWLKKEVVKHGEDLPAAPGIGSLQLALFEGCAEGKLWNPTFIIDYPVEVSPLARASDTNPKLTERFELFAVGRELANGYSELNDPEDQADRFRSQVAQKEAGDDEAMNYDADYIRAMEYGLPPTGGCGIGIDRLVMLLTNAPSIRDVILFPHMRPEEGQN